MKYGLEKTWLFSFLWLAFPHRGDLKTTFQYVKGNHKRENGFRLSRGKVKLDLRKKFSVLRAVRH